VIFFMAVFEVIGWWLFFYSARTIRKEPPLSFARFLGYLLIVLLSFDVLFAAGYLGHPRNNGLLIIFLSGNAGLIAFLAVSRLRRL